jgi:hypothetical protein
MPRQAGHVRPHHRLAQDCGGSRVERLTPLHDVEQDVEIEHDLHRCFSNRWAR